MKLQDAGTIWWSITIIFLAIGITNAATTMDSTNIQKPVTTPKKLVCKAHTLASAQIITGGMSVWADDYASHGGGLATCPNGTMMVGLYNAYGGDWGSKTNWVAGICVQPTITCTWV